MGGALRRVRGGIARLLTLPREEWEAIESRLLSRGFTLADVPGRVTWRAVKVMLRHPWQDAEHLAALQVDVARLLLWTKTEDGSKGRNQPDPIPRPGDAERRALAADAAIAAAEAAGLTRREAIA